MSTETLKQPRTRTPRDYDSIEKGALSLSFDDRVKLTNKLTQSVNDELAADTAEAERKSKLIGIPKPFLPNTNGDPLDK